MAPISYDIKYATALEVAMCDESVTYSPAPRNLSRNNLTSLVAGDFPSLPDLQFL